IQVGSAAIDQALSNTNDRMANPRNEINRTNTTPGGATFISDYPNPERTRAESLFGAERIITNNPLPGNFTTRDHDGFDRLDDPSTPNVGVGTDPFFDMGAYDLRDLERPL